MCSWVAQSSFCVLACLLRWIRDLSLSPSVRSAFPPILLVHVLTLLWPGFMLWSSFENAGHLVRLFLHLHSSFSSFLPFVFRLLPSGLLHLLPPPSCIFPFISPVVSTLFFLLISLPPPLPVSSIHFFWETVFDQSLTVKSTKDVKHCQGGFTSSIMFSFPSSQKEYRLLCSWDFPGTNTGGGYHFLLQGIFWPRNQTCISYVPCIGRQVL